MTSRSIRSAKSKSLSIFENYVEHRGEKVATESYVLLTQKNVTNDYALTGCIQVSAMMYLILLKTACGLIATSGSSI